MTTIRHIACGQIITRGMAGLLHEQACATHRRLAAILDAIDPQETSHAHR